MYPHNIIIAMAKQKQVVSKIHRSPQSPILIIRLILICADRALDTEYDWILILLKAHHYDNVATTDKRHETIGQQVWSRGSVMDRDCKDQGLENSGISLVAARCTRGCTKSRLHPAVSLPWYLAFDSSSIKICSKVHSLLSLCDGVMETLSLSVFSESSRHITLKA